MQAELLAALPIDRLERQGRFFPCGFRGFPLVGAFPVA